MADANYQEWNSRVIDCFEDPRSCASMCFCPCCYACWVTHKYGKNPAILAFDLCSLGMLNCIGLPLCVAPASLAIRMDMRKKYGINGTIYKDLAITCACLCCVWCQMAREVEHQKNKKQQVVNFQPAAAGYQQHSLPVPHQDPTGAIVATY